jgi:antitoxin ParD1/3/4
MAKNTSILLGAYFDEFIQRKVKSGRYTSASEVVREALRLFEQHEKREEELEKALKEGADSEMIADFDARGFLKELHKKHL